MQECRVRLGSIRIGTCISLLVAALAVAALDATPALAQELPARPAGLNLILSVMLSAGSDRPAASDRRKARRSAPWPTTILE